MTSEQLRERAQKFLDGAEWDAATVGGEQEIRLLTSLLASIRAETLEECCKAVCSECRDSGNLESAALFNGAWKHKVKAGKGAGYFSCDAAAIRDAGKK